MQRVLSRHLFFIGLMFVMFNYKQSLEKKQLHFELTFSSANDNNTHFKLSWSRLDRFNS